MLEKSHSQRDYRTFQELDMKKKIAKWLRRLADRFYPQPIPPMILPSLNDVKRIETNYELKLLQSKVTIDVIIGPYFKKRSVMNENQVYEELTRRLAKEMRACGMVKYDIQVDNRLCRTMSASVYVGMKKDNHNI